MWGKKSLVSAELLFDGRMVPSDIIKDPTNNPGAASSPQTGHSDTILLGGRIFPENSQKRCALCQNSIPNSVKPCTFPSTAPAALAALNPHLGSEAYSSGPKVFCHKCWVWIHNLSICWTCGETVARGEEKVSYGWCWWHWACVSCMICRVGTYSLLIFCLPFAEGVGDGRSKTCRTIWNMALTIKYISF